MKLLEQCILVTEKLVFLAKLSDENNRDETISQIEKLLDERENLLPLIQGPFSPEEHIEGKKLIKLNEELAGLLGKFHAYIQRDINELEQKKIFAAKYANPYAVTQQHDGAFYDKRK